MSEKPCQTLSECREKLTQLEQKYQAKYWEFISTVNVEEQKWLRENKEIIEAKKEQLVKAFLLSIDEEVGITDYFEECYIPRTYKDHRPIYHMRDTDNCKDRVKNFRFAWKQFLDKHNITPSIIFKAEERGIPFFIDLKNVENTDYMGKPWNSDKEPPHICKINTYGVVLDGKRVKRGSIYETDVEPIKVKHKMVCDEKYTYCWLEKLPDSE